MAIFIKIEREDMGFYIDRLENIQNILDGEILNGDVGEPVTLTLVEMTQEEYDNLPEFMGW